MKSRRLGTTRLTLTELGFGAAPIGNSRMSVDDATASSALSAAWDAGMRYVDTAPFYGFGLSERRVGDGLRLHERNDFVLSSKVGRLLKPVPGHRGDAPRFGFRSSMPFEPLFDYSYDGVMRSFEDSLQRLGLARIDILLAHDIGEVTHGAANREHFETLMSGGYRALDELRATGAIAAIGLGVNEWEICEAAMQRGRFDCFLLAGRYTLLEQCALESFLPKCAAHGASVIIGGPHNSGILAAGTRGGGTLYYNYAPAPPAIIERVQRIEAICDAHGVAMGAAALQFPLAHPTICSVIPGMESAQRVAQTMALFNTRIPEAFWRDMKAAGLIRTDAPTP